MKTRVRAPDPPSGWHPLLWALVDLVGLTERAVRVRARVSVSALANAQTGRRIADDAVVRMAALLRHQTDAMTDLMADRHRLDADVRAYRDGLFLVLNAIHSEFRLGNPKPPPERTDSDLGQDLLAAVDPRGSLPSVVVGALRRVYTATTVRRAARRYLVIRAHEDGRVYWHPPPDVEQPRFPLPVPTARRATTIAGRAIEGIIVRELARREDPTPARMVLVVALGYGHTHAAVYRVARRMNLVRRTTGFGPHKVMTWALPHVEIDPGASLPAPPSKVVRVDFATPLCPLCQSRHHGECP